MTAGHQPLSNLTRRQALGLGAESARLCPLSHRLSRDPLKDRNRSYLVRTIFSIRGGVK